MPVSWTTEQVKGLAPDPASLQAGRGLASPRKWSEIGGDEAAIWGLAQGSGKQPYQVQIAIPDFASRCSCPSRKFPCKHALGLLLLTAEQPTALGNAPRPAWVDEWLQGRAQRAAKAEAAASQPKPPVDAAAREKRQQRREGRVADGVALLQQWLEDQMRQGLAEASLSQPKTWDELSRRMVDSQAPGLARQLRAIAPLALGGATAITQVLSALGRLQLLLEAYASRSSLPPELAAEVEQAMGATVSQQELKERQGMRDQWFLAARTREQEDRLLVTTTWLFGLGCRRWAELLEFSPVGQGHSKAAFALGSTIDLELVFYPGVRPHRAIRRSDDDAHVLSLSIDPAQLPLLPSWQELLVEQAAALAANPWCTQTPFLLHAQPGHHGNQDVLVDRDGSALPWRPPLAGPFALMALAGGYPVPLCGVFDGTEAKVLSAFSEGQWLALAAEEA
jgi:hypothetical protein